MAQFDKYTDCEGKSHSIGKWGRREDWEKGLKNSITCDFGGNCTKEKSWRHRGYLERGKSLGSPRWLCDTHFQEVFGNKGLLCRDEYPDGRKEEKYLWGSPQGKLKPGFKKEGAHQCLENTGCAGCGGAFDGEFYDGPKVDPTKQGAKGGYSKTYCSQCAHYQASDFEKGFGGACCLCDDNAKYTMLRKEKHPCEDKDPPHTPKMKGCFCQKHYQELIGEPDTMGITAGCGLTAEMVDDCLTRIWSSGGQPVIMPTKPKKGGIMSNVVRKVKDLTKSKEQKLLEKYDVVDECGDLTDTGQRLVIEKALAAHKAEIVADLEKVQSDEDKKRK